MMDLRIDCLRLDVRNAKGQERRLGVIAERAAALFAREAAKRFERLGRDAEVGTVSAPRMDMNLDRTSDETAARAIAAAWLDSLALKLRT